MKTDDSMYREREDGEKQGFRNTETIKLEGKSYGGSTKFCELFARSLTKRANIPVKCAPKQKTFTSADNVDWYLPVTEFKENYAEIKFDVNGKAEPNCEYNAKSCPKPDTFKYYVNAYGKIVEEKPQTYQTTYCITTKITGSGSVLPSNTYCGLTNGTYTLTAVPSPDWSSNWENNEKSITINGKDEETSVTFTEAPKACIKLNVNCANNANICGSYTLTNGTFSQNENEYTACNLKPGSYTVNVTPKSNYTSNWTTQIVTLNGLDQILNVTLSEKTYCAKLNVDCPAGSANLCGSYVINGDKEMTASSDYARLCSLRSGSYDLQITPLQAGGKAKYKVTPQDISFTITDSDWEGNASFEKLVKNCKEDGYFEAGGKKWTCPFLPTPINRSECEAEKSRLGIRECDYDNDYWAGAVKQCGGINKMPTMDDLAKIASLIYKGNPTVGAYNDVYNLTYESGTATSLGLHEPLFLLWSGEEYSENRAYGRDFTPTYTDYNYTYRYNSGKQAFCLVD